jgi:hypothetical protein
MRLNGTRGAGSDKPRGAQSAESRRPIVGLGSDRLGRADDEFSCSAARHALHSEFRPVEPDGLAHTIGVDDGQLAPQDFSINKPRLGGEHQRHVASIHDVVDSAVEPLVHEPNGVAEQSVRDAVEPGWIGVEPERIGI